MSNTYVEINKYWDRISKVIICLIDAGLNYYFLRIVKQRLLDQYGLMKYSPLVTFNARLMFISVLLDVSAPLSLRCDWKQPKLTTALQVLLIGLMSLPNQLVFILFHPLVCK